MTEPPELGLDDSWRAGARRILRALGLVRRTAPRDTIEVGILIPIQGVLAPLQLLVLKQLVDALVGLIAGHPGALATSLGYVAAGGSLTVAGAMLQARSRLITERLGLEVSDRVRGLIQAHSITLDLAFSEASEFHDRLYRAQREGGSRSAQILQTMVSLLRDGISFVAVAGLLFVTLPQAALLAAGAALPALWIRVRHSRKTFLRRRRFTGRERLAMAMDALLTQPPAAKEVRLLGLGPHLAARYKELRDLVRHETLALARERAWGHVWAQAAGAIVVFGTLGLVVLRVAQATLALGAAVMCFQALQRVFTLSQSLLASVADLHEGALFLRDLEEFFLLRPQIVDPAVGAGAAPPSRGSLVFENVTFRYPGADHDVLSGLNIEVKPGEVVALVGENGAGKTTLVKLACRLYEADSGRVLLDNVDVRDFRLADLRRAFGVVFQDFVHFPATFHDNVGYGDVSRLKDTDRVRAAAVWAGAEEIASALPRGFDTLLGRFLEGGQELSIGQWQRLALARACFRDAAVLVLDEPTGALDALAEAQLHQRLRELLRGKTVLLISHRFSSVAMADRIYVLENGRVAESGTHAELMRAEGPYARMYSAQAQPYQSRADRET